MRYLIQMNLNRSRDLSDMVTRPGRRNTNKYLEIAMLDHIGL